MRMFNIKSYWILVGAEPDAAAAGGLLVFSMAASALSNSACLSEPVSITHIYPFVISEMSLSIWRKDK